MYISHRRELASDLYTLPPQQRKTKIKLNLKTSDLYTLPPQQRKNKIKLNLKKAEDNK